MTYVFLNNFQQAKVMRIEELLVVKHIVGGKGLF